MSRFFKKLPVVYAHCDIPCGIYDPHRAQLAALTVIRMADLLKEKKDTHNIVRLTAVKEEHAEICKQEIRIIWGDYFKAEHFVKYPEIDKLSHEIMQLSSKTRQSTDKEAAAELLRAVSRFAEIFWETKGVKTKRTKAPYEPMEEIVVPEL